MMEEKQEYLTRIAKKSDCYLFDAMRPMVIAIDGPAGAGKSTVARMLANRLGYCHIDSGAMYRALTLVALREHLDTDCQEQMVDLLGRLSMSVQASDTGMRIWVNELEMTDCIRDPAVSRQVSRVARHAEVRTRLVALQRELAKAGGIVMDGRDIGTHVLPDAPLKIFLTASIKERALRRLAELEYKGIHKSLDEMEQEMTVRDQTDSQREASPLIKADDAVEVDTSSLTIDQVVALIITLARTRGLIAPTGE